MGPFFFLSDRGVPLVSYLGLIAVIFFLMKSLGPSLGDLEELILGAEPLPALDRLFSPWLVFDIASLGLTLFYGNFF